MGARSGDQPGPASEWTIVDFERARGDFPIRTFAQRLGRRDANEAAALVNKLNARGNMLRPPDSKALEGHPGLFELRGHQIRLFYVFRPARVIVMLDGIIKKQDKIRTTDLKRIVGYQRDVEQRGPRAP